MLSNGVILLHDNAPDTSQSSKDDTVAVFATLQGVGNAGISTVQSRIFSMCFLVFGSIKRAIRGHRFTTEDEVCDWV
ncbi:hypothetical protein TNCV_4062001 [Trichonephila clavipes]|nr:hypothetical protein TNCV_4062001 [Trichonephila clavipes]